MCVKGVEPRCPRSRSWIHSCKVLKQGGGAPKPLLYVHGGGAAQFPDCPAMHRRNCLAPRTQSGPAHGLAPRYDMVRLAVPAFGGSGAEMRSDGGWDDRPHAL